MRVKFCSLRRKCTTGSLIFCYLPFWFVLFGDLFPFIIWSIWAVFSRILLLTWHQGLMLCIKCHNWPETHWTGLQEWCLEFDFFFWGGEGRTPPVLKKGISDHDKDLLLQISVIDQFTRGMIKLLFLWSLVYTQC